MAYSLAWLGWEAGADRGGLFSIRAELVGKAYPPLSAPGLKKVPTGSTRPLSHGLSLIEATARNRLAPTKRAKLSGVERPTLSSCHIFDSGLAPLQTGGRVLLQHAVHLVVHLVLHPAVHLVVHLVAHLGADVEKFSWICHLQQKVSRSKYYSKVIPPFRADRALGEKKGGAIFLSPRRYDYGVVKPRFPPPKFRMTLTDSCPPHA
jgi:hypothetical protein